MERVGVGLGLEETHVLVTGGAGFIGSHVVSAFLSAGAKVTCLDISLDALNALALRLQDLHPKDLNRYRATKVDIRDEAGLEQAFEEAAVAFGIVQCCVALASLDLSVLQHHTSICDMPYAQFRETHEVNVFGTFLTVRAWAKLLRANRQTRLRNVSTVIVGSESGTFGERGNPDYASAKSAVQGGLLQSLKADLPRLYSGARANVIAPGPVDTPQFRIECKTSPSQLWHDAEATTALGRPVPMVEVARSILYLASDNFSGSVHGQILHVDCGKQGKLMYEEGEAAEYR